MSHRAFVARGRIVLRRALQSLRPDDHEVRAHFRRLRTEFYLDFWTGAAHGVGAEIERVEGDLLRVRRGDQWTWVSIFEVMLDTHLGVKVAANKPVVHKAFAEAGLPAPPYLVYSMASFDRAVRFMEEQGGAVVVKPAQGTGAGQGVTTGIDDVRTLETASINAADYFAAPLMVERHLAGSSYRLLYLGGRFIDAVRRDPPTVVGDGKRSVRELVEAETVRRYSSGNVVALHPLPMDLDGRLHLARQGLTLASVPESGRRVEVKNVVNQNAARENHIVRDEIHPDVVEQGARLVAHVGLDIAGVDLMSSDVSRPLEGSDTYFNEINAMPGLHHHVLVAERSRTLPVGEMVLEHVFASAKAPAAGTSL